MPKSTKSSKKESAEQPVNDRAARYNALKTQYGDIGRIHPILPVDPSTCLKPYSTQWALSTNECGFRPGSVIEVYGMEMTLKTEQALLLCKAAQEQFPTQSVLYCDPEEAVDLFIAEHRLGIDMGMLDPDIGLKKFIYYPDPSTDVIPTMEDYLNRIYDFAASGLFSLIVLDSVKACQTRYEEKQEDITQQKVAGPALVMSNAFSKIKAICRRTGTRLLCVNQLREKFIKTPQGVITKAEPTGGNSLKFAATHRYRFSWAEKKKETNDQHLIIYSEKVKYGPVWRAIEVPITLGRGYNVEADLLEAAVQTGVLGKNGSWFTKDGKNLANGEKQGCQLLQAQPALFAEIRDAVYAAAAPDLNKAYVPPTAEESEEVTE